MNVFFSISLLFSFQVAYAMLGHQAAETVCHPQCLKKYGYVILSFRLPVARGFIDDGNCKCVPSNRLLESPLLARYPRFDVEQLKSTFGCSPWVTWGYLKYCGFMFVSKEELLKEECKSLGRVVN
nr:PREDICTED: uncharacterized protein LOC109040315 [Bemisia tabaci]